GLAVVAGHQPGRHATVGLELIGCENGDVQVGRVLFGQTGQHVHMGMPGSEQQEFLDALVHGPDDRGD
ncbi:hypothetical protein RZS08_42460, partial [Arthrospira platensis SPKY1]|nr:hypothetical protein [Arthrospira platensis SPKY1]